MSQPAKIRPVLLAVLVALKGLRGGEAVVLGLQSSLAFSLVLIVTAFACASGNPPVIDTGSAKSISLPSRDVTLFAYATDPEKDPLTVSWAQTGGPAPVTFSAPQALTTTVTFTTAGVYTFRLTVSDGTSVVTANASVTVKDASSQTAFYVDPTYTGTTRDGSAARPWTTELATDRPNAAWTAINNALATNDVIVYFSARQAGSDTPEQLTSGINLWRTDTSTHRLTLDGMSKYNTNDATPSWADYTGQNRFKLNMATGSISIGVQSTNPGYPAHYTTIRGFEVTGPGSRLTWAGNSSVVEYVWLHDVSAIGATLMFHGAVKSDCTPLFGNLRDITVRNNRIERGMGEGIYIAGNYILASDGGCPSWGNTHSDVLIEDNTIIDPGYNGEQGDGIDLKAGLRNVTVRGNLIQQTDGGLRAAAQGARCIVSSGIFGTATTVGNYLIEQNEAFACPGFSLQQNNGVTVRNNVLGNVISSGVGTNIITDSNTSERNKNIAIYNNTLYDGVIVLQFQDGATLYNNLVSGIGTGTIQLQAHGSSTAISSDYNALVSGATTENWSEGVHSLYLPVAAALFVSPSAFDFHLVPGVVPIDAGTSLATGLARLDTGFASDLSGMARPQGQAWDIGAFEFGTALPPPSNLQVR